MNAHKVLKTVLLSEKANKQSAELVNTRSRFTRTPTNTPSPSRLNKPSR
jgi:hypothetical protein